MNIVDAAIKGRMNNHLNANQVIAIRTSEATNKALSAMMGVSPTTISDVRSRKRYKYVP